jgi:2-hydroxymuconate-semialdehyde hydrolase
MDTTAHKIGTGPLETLYNQAGDPGATPVILLHGSGPGANAMSNWVYALPFLGERYRAIAPDLAGFGESTLPNPPRGAAAWIEVWTAQVIALMDALDIPKAHLVGNSMGGGVSLQLLRRHPQRFERVVLMGAVGAPHTATPGLHRGWGYYRTGTQEELAYLVGKFLHDPGVLGGDVEAIARQRYALVMQDHIRTQFEAMFPGDAQVHVDAFVVPEHELRAMTHPMLVTHGREDFFIPVATSLYVAERVPNAQLHVFHHCGHWIQIEQRAAFNELVRDFFDGRFG